MSRRHTGSRIANGIITRDRRRQTYKKIQMEAKARPESVQVGTSDGMVWMSPMEHRLYDAMLKEGLTPVAQCLVEGYIVDFAFPDIKLAIEADGAAFHTEDRHERDRKRDWILGKKGWTVKRYHGSTIYSKPSNCAREVKHEVEERRARAGMEAGSTTWGKFLVFFKGEPRKRP
jgi:very-short-patch-repair endonuclease